MRTAKEWQEHGLGWVNECLIAGVQTDARAELLERIKALEAENTRLRRDLMDPPADIQELVIKKLNLVSAEALTQAHVALIKLALVALEDCLDVKNADAIAAIKDCEVTL